jgi:hypothetical protein
MVTKRPAGHTAPAPQHRPEAAAPDRGCNAWGRCTSRPFHVCIAELPADERGEFSSAWRTVLRYVAAPGETIPP